VGAELEKAVREVEQTTEQESESVQQLVEANNSVSLTAVNENGSQMSPLYAIENT
jgi:hypothetical protein